MRAQIILRLTVMWNLFAKDTATSVEPACKSFKCSFSTRSLVNFLFPEGMIGFRIVNFWFDKFSLPPIWSRPLLSRNGRRFRIFQLAASCLTSLHGGISCENSANCVVLTQNLLASVNSFADKWSFIRSSWLTRDLAPNRNIHAVIRYGWL